MPETLIKTPLIPTEKEAIKLGAMADKSAKIEFPVVQQSPLNMSMNVSRELDPEKEAEAVQLSGEFNLSPDLAREIPKAQLGIDRDKEIAEDESTPQAVQDFLAMSPTNAAIARGDIDKLNKVTKSSPYHYIYDDAAALRGLTRPLSEQHFDKDVKRPYSYGAPKDPKSWLQRTITNPFAFGDERMGQLGILYAQKYLRGGVSPLPAEAGLGVAADQVDSRIKTIEDRWSAHYELDGLDYFVSSGSELLGQMWAGFRDFGLTRSIEGGVLGASTAAVLGQAGPQALTPEEIVTVPALGLTGMGIGAATGLIENTFWVEAGHAAKELADIRDENDQPLDPDMIKAAAYGVGTVNAALEIGGIAALKRLGQIIPGGKQAMRGFIKEGAIGALQNPTVRAKILGVMKNYATGVLGETATEIGQEISPILAQHIISDISDKYSGTDFNSQVGDLANAENRQRLLDIAKKTMAGTLALGFFPAMTRASIGAAQARRATEFHERIADMHEGVQDSKTFQRSPDKMREFLERSTHVETEGLASPAEMQLPVDENTMTLFQENPEIFEDLGITESMLLSARELGHDVPVRVSDVMTKVDPAGFAVLSPFLKASPESMNQVNASNFDFRREVADAAQVYQETYGAQEDGLRTEMDRLRGEMETAGLTADMTASNLDLLEQFSRTAFERGWSTDMAGTARKIALGEQRQAEFDEAVGAEPVPGRETLFQTDLTRVGSRISIAPLQAPEFKSRAGKYVKRDTINQILKRKGTKQIEKTIMQDVLDQDQFKDQKDIDVDMFALAVEAELMPLEQIETQTYADYGADNIGASPDESASVVYNSHLDHGFTDHFSRDFSEKAERPKKAFYLVSPDGEYLHENSGVHVLQEGQDILDVLGDQVRTPPLRFGTEQLASEYLKSSSFEEGVNVAPIPKFEVVEREIQHPDKWEITEVTGKPGTFIALEADRPASATDAETLQNYVGTAGSLETVQAWVARQDARDSIAKNKGVFGHVRRWDDEGNRYLAELQSDPYQKNNARDLVAKSIRESPRTPEQESVRDRLAELAQQLFDIPQSIVLAYDNNAKTFKDIQEQKALGEEGDVGYFQALLDASMAEIEKDGNMAEYEAYYNLLAERKKLLSKGIEETYTAKEKQFIAHRKNYTERMLKEEIKQAALDGKDSLMIPTPHTVSLIEGYQSEEGEGAMPYEITSRREPGGDLQVADEIDGFEGAMIVVGATSDTIEVVGGEFREFSLEQFMSEEVDFNVGEIIDELDLAEFDPSEGSEAWSDLPDYAGQMTGSEIITAFRNYIDDRSHEGLLDSSDIEQAVREYFEEHKYGEEQALETLRETNTTVGHNEDNGQIVVSENVAETLLQPDQYSETTKEDFEIENLAEEYQGIVKKYEDLGKFLEDERGDKYSLHTDPNGYDWYSTTVGRSDIVDPVILFQGETMRRGSVTITDDQYLVNLMSNANASTLPHEFGHVFLEEMRQFVKAEDSPREVQDDWAAIQTWLEVDLEEGVTVKQHEKFAKGFEKYLLEGQAPSPELAGAFERFRKWMLNIYKKAVNLEADLDPEIRAVFDRMLASERQIEEAAITNEAVTLTQKEMKALGLKDDERAYLKRLINASKKTAEERLHRAKEQKKKARAAEWAVEAEAQIQDDPVYVLRANLYENGGLDAFATEAEFGKEVVQEIRKLNVRFVKQDSVMPGVAAVDSGFDSAAQMVEVLLSSPSKAERIAEIVEEKAQSQENRVDATGELLDSPEFLEHMEATGRYISRAVDGKESALTRRAIKAAVERELNGRIVKRAIRTDKFLNAMRKAMREEREALSRGDFRAALIANRKARMNYELTRQSRNLAKDAQKIQDRVKRLAKSKPGNIDGDFQLNIISLAQRFNLGTKGLFKIDTSRKKPLATLITAPNDPLLDVGAAFGDWLLGEQYANDYRELTVNEFRELNDLVKHLYGRGRDIVKQNIDHADASKAEVVEKTIEPTQDLKTKKIWSEHSRIGKLVMSARKYFASTDMFLFVMKAMDGYSNVGKDGTMGPNEELLYRPLAKAYSARQVALAEVKAKLDAPLARLTKSAAAHPAKLNVPGVPTPGIMARNGLTWSFERILAVALNMGNESNKKALLEGYDLTEPQLQALIAPLSKEDWNDIQEIWDVVNSLWPETNKVFRELNYFDQKKIEAVPFTVTTDNGEIVPMRGGYYPLKFDPELDDTGRVGEWSEKDDLMNATDAMFPTPTARSGFMQSRVGAGKLPPKLTLGVLSDHLDHAVQYITHAKVLRDIDRVTRDPQYKRAMEDKLGKEAYKMVRPSLKYVARSEGELLGVIDGWLEKHRILATGYILGANVSVAMKQPFSAFGFVNDEGAGTLFRGMGKVLTSPLEAGRIMHKLSPYMANRAKTIDRDLGDSLKRIGPKDTVIAGVRVSDVQNSMFVLIRAMDYVTVFPAWWGSYLKAMGETGGDIEASVTHADEAIAESQPSSRPMDLSHFQRSNKGMHRLFTMFSTFTMKYGSRQRAHYNAWKSGALSNPQYFRHIVLEAVLPPLIMRSMFTMLWGRSPADEDDWGDAVWDVFLYQFIGLPYFRDILNTVSSGVRGKFVGDPWDSPVFQGLEIGTDLLTAMGNWIQDLEDDDKAEKAVWAFAEIVSYKIRIPASRVYEKLKKGMEQWEEEDGTPFNILVPDYNKKEK